MISFWKRVWTEINLDNLVHNYRCIREHLPEKVELCCVIKANAYGHSAPRVAKALSEVGATWFAVSNIEEALELRYRGIKQSILILGYTPPECAEILIDNDISQCVYSSEYATLLASAVDQCAKRLKIHIKLDTGMGRIGFQYDNMPSVVNDIVSCCQSSAFDVEGIFTHFAVSDSGKDGKDFTCAQYEKFREITNAVEDRGVSFKYKHCANSAATLDYPEFSMNMVRVGIILYGLTPSDNMNSSLKLKPVMTLKAIISHIKNVKAGATISYGSDFIAEKDMTIATVPMGYADGFWRSNYEAESKLVVHGQLAPIVGRICMDQLMVDISNIEGVCVGDTVTVFGDIDGLNTVNDFAKRNHTINYEIICSVGKRVPRVFIRNSVVDGINLGILGDNC